MNNYKIILAAIACCLGSNFTMYSQVKEEFPYRNAVKLNLAAFIFDNVSWQYERLLKNYWAFQLGGNFKWGGDIPKVVGFGDFIVTGNSTGLKGYAFTPESRYYFKRCEGSQSGSGLYSGVYSRMTRLYSDLSFHYWNGNQYVDANGHGSMYELGIGLQLGYQLKLGKRMLIDLMFMGPRTSRHWLNLELDSNFAEEIVPLIEEKLNSKLEYLGIDPVSIPSASKTQVKFGFSYFRYAVSIGYFF